MYTASQKQQSAVKVRCCPKRRSVHVPPLNSGVFLLLLLLGLRKVHLRVELESYDVLELQAELVVVELLLLALEGLQLHGNLEVVLEAVDVVLLHDCVALDALLALCFGVFGERQVSLEGVDGEDLPGQLEGSHAGHLADVLAADRLLNLVVGIDIELPRAEGGHALLFVCFDGSRCCSYFRQAAQLIERGLCPIQFLAASFPESKKVLGGSDDFFFRLVVGEEGRLLPFVTYGVDFCPDGEDELLDGEALLEHALLHHQSYNLQFYSSRQAISTRIPDHAQLLLLGQILSLSLVGLGEGRGLEQELALGLFELDELEHLAGHLCFCIVVDSSVFMLHFLAVEVEVVVGLVGEAAVHPLPDGHSLGRHPSCLLFQRLLPEFHLQLRG